jgi:hypothetical protein
MKSRGRGKRADREPAHALRLGRHHASRTTAGLHRHCSLGRYAADPTNPLQLFRDECDRLGILADLNVAMSGAITDAEARVYGSCG